MLKCVLALIFLTFATIARAEEGPQTCDTRLDFAAAFQQLIGYCKGDSCTMPDDAKERHCGVGIGAALSLRFKQVAHKIVRINQLCVGGCLSFAMHAPQFVCLGPHGSFAFFRAAGKDVDKDPNYPKEVMEWAMRKKSELTPDQREKLYPKEKYPNRIFPFVDDVKNGFIMSRDEAFSVGYIPCKEPAVAIATPK